MNTLVTLGALLAAGLLPPALPAAAAPLPRLIRACSRTTVKAILHRPGSTDATGHCSCPLERHTSAAHCDRSWRSGAHRGARA